MLAATVLLALHLLATTEAVNFYKCPEESPIIGDDTASGPITLTPSIPFYGGYYDTAYVGSNGIVQFQTPPASTNKETIGVFPVAGSIFLAPLYSDLAQDGDVTWCYSNKTEQIEQQIRRNFTSFSSLEFAIIATWNNIGYHDSPALRNTFQCVITTDGSMSFALFLYDKLQWSEANPAHVGFNNGSEDIFSELPCSNNPKVVSLAETSNVGMDGLWLFRIDQNTIETSCTNRATCKECSCQEYQTGGCICNRNKDEEEKSCTPELPSTGPQATTGDSSFSIATSIFALLSTAAVTVLCLIIMRT